MHKGQRYLWGWKSCRKMFLWCSDSSSLICVINELSSSYTWDWDWRLVLWLWCENQLTENPPWMSTVFHTITTTPSIFNLNLTCKMSLKYLSICHLRFVIFRVTFRYIIRKGSFLSLSQDIVLWEDLSLQAQSRNLRHKSLRFPVHQSAWSVLLSLFLFLPALVRVPGSVDSKG